jgi:hypothetical protein
MIDHSIYLVACERENPSNEEGFLLIHGSSF